MASRTLIRKFGALIIAIQVAAAVSAQAEQSNTAELINQFNEVVSLDYSLDSLASRVSSGRVDSIPKDRIMIFDGTVSSRQLIDPSEQNYFGILELSSGNWEDGEELAMYRCYVQLKGPDFVGTVPEPRSRSQNPSEIPLHSHILLMGRYIGYGQDQQGNRFPVLEAVEIKVLQ